MSNPLKDLEKFGQSPWIDMISRKMIDSGELKRLIAEDGAKGLTSNPAIFQKAVAGGAEYDNAIARGLAGGVSDPLRLFELLAIEDIRDAADLFAPVHKKAGGGDGFVSLEVNPKLAYDTEGTIADALRLAAEVARPNLMIKIPATKEGLPAITRVLAEGVNVNVTLIFSLTRYREVMEAYLAGLESLAAKGGDVSSANSVASFFVSRLDAAVEKLAGKGSPLCGKVAVANTKLAYKAFLEVFGGKRFAKLKAEGARVQRPLWASTGTKSPELSDVLYVDALIGPDTVNTIPPATWDAFRDHGTAAETLASGMDEAARTMADLAAAGLSIDEITDGLEKDGVDSFVKSFDALLASVAEKAGRLRGTTAASSEKKTADGLDPAETISRLWAADASLWKTEAAHRAVIDKSLGWLRMPRVMPERLPEIERFVSEVRRDGFEHVVVLGMGGSSLAPEVLRRTFPHVPGFPALHVLDSTEPEAVAAVEQAAPPGKTLYLVASKSGTTVEPMRFFDYFWARTKEVRGAKTGESFVAVTDPGRPLMAQAQETGFRRVFLNFEDIGGRYSALSYFGLVPAALAGIDARKLLERAHRMADACALKTPDNPGLELGLALAAHAREGRDKLHFFMPRGLDSFGLWIEQLVAESVGKEGQGVVPVTGEQPLDPERYASDKVFIHIRCAALPEKRLDADVERLRKAGRPVLVLDLQDAYDLGAEFFRWEVATAVLGASLGIDPFDQPDVQAAKERTTSLLGALKRDGALPDPEAQADGDGLAMTFSSASRRAMKADAAALDIEEALTRFLGDRAEGDYVGLLAYVGSHGRYESSLRKLRTSLGQAAGLSVQCGYGPRYLHSTGQLHKGGGNNGLFLVISRADGPDLALPGSNYSFAQLARAQALGDFQALDAAGRRAVLIRTTGDADKALTRIKKCVDAAAHAAMKV